MTKGLPSAPSFNVWSRSAVFPVESRRTKRLDANLVLDQVGIDQGHNLSAQRLILFKAVCIEDLEPDLEIRVANENGRILLVTVSLALQEPALVRIRIFEIETRVQALDNVPVRDDR